MLKIKCIETGPLITNCYVVYDEIEKSAIIIDCTIDGFYDIKNFIESQKLIPQYIILTHSHWDHCGDAYKLKDYYSIDIYCHKDDEYRLENPKKYSLFDLPYEIKGIKADKYLNDNDTINLNNHKFIVLHTAGHTEGSICIYEPDNKIAFVGDLIFKGSIGRTDLPGGDFMEILQSLKKIINKFDRETIIYSGHGPTTTIKQEIDTNPFIINYLEISDISNEN